MAANIYNKRLRLAYRQIQAENSDASTIPVGNLLKDMESDKEDVLQTPEQIREFFAGFSRLDPLTPAQTQLLSQIAERALKLREEQAPADSSIAIISEPTVETASEDTVVVEPVAPATSTPDVSQPISAPVSSEVFNPDEFNEWSRINPGESAITSRTGEDGKVTISWIATPNKIYRVSASNDEMPTTRGVPSKTEIVRGNTVTFPNHFQYTAVFEFDEPKTKGRIFGTLETLGAPLDFQLQPTSRDVRMQWINTNPEVRLVIARSEPNKKLPEVITDGFIINKDEVPTKTIYVDTAALAGERYEYKVWLQKSVNGVKVDGAVSTFDIEVPGNIPDIEAFTASRSEENPLEIDISYKLPEVENAKVTVYHVEDLPSGPLLGLRAQSDPLEAARLTEPRIVQFIGEKIIAEPVTEDGMVYIRNYPLPKIEVGSRTFIAVVALGEYVKISGISVIQQVGDISTLEIIDRYDYQIMRVGLPKGANVLQVWIQNPDTDWSEVNQKEPSREVDIENEYRKFGGIVFANGLNAIPASVSLGHEPKRIFVRGASAWEGDYQVAAKPAFRDYEGRVVIHTEKREAQVEDNSRGGFFKKAPKAPAQKLYNFVVKVDSPFGVPSPITLFKLTGTNGSFPTSSHLQAQSTLDLDIEKYRQPSFLQWKQGGVDSSPVTLQIPATEECRFVPSLRAIELADEKEIPIFVVDDEISRIQAQLPDFQPSGRGFKIALVGPKKSGKTTYVQALLNYLERQYSPIHSMVMSPDPDSQAAELRFKELHDFLDNGQKPDPTKSAGIFNMAPRTEPNDPRTPIKFVFEGPRAPFTDLTFYDVAGEDMDTEEGIALYEPELLGADLVLFLLDPQQIQSTRTALGGRADFDVNAVDPTHVLKNIGKLLKGKPERNPNQRVAVAVSKFDSFVEASNSKVTNVFQSMVTPGMSVTRDLNSWTQKAFNNADSVQVHREVSALLKLDQSLNAFVDGLEQTFAVPTRLFAVSALGHFTFEKSIASTGITSFRVADPLLWVVASAANLVNPAGQ